MSDQCKPCTLRGDFSACDRADCGHHDTWYARELRTELNKAWEARRELVAGLELACKNRATTGMSEYIYLEALIDKYKEPQ